MPRATAVFHTTFSGQGVIRVEDITKDERYGKNKPYNGMPEGHLPVKSYLAVPVISKSGTVIGGLFFGHPQPGIFSEESEKLVLGVASQAAIAIDNARMFEDLNYTNEENKRLLTLSQQSDRKKDEFLSIASHELKTPLTSIKAYLQLLEKSDEQNERSKNFVSKAVVHVSKMERLISDLLDVSKINADNLSYKIDFFDFKEAVNECVENAQHLTDTHQIIIKNNSSIQVLGDKIRIEQVISNFISNAIKYSPGAYEIVLNVDVNNNNLVFSVEDFGIGIEGNHIDKIFERFYRVEATSMRYQGLGLGLFISGEILKAHQGAFWLESELGKGSTFFFSLPLNYESKPQPAITDNNYEDEYISISYNETSNYIEVDWRGVQNFDSVSMGGKLILDMVISTGSTKILNDNSKVIGNWANATDEGREVWFPALENAGIGHFAWVQSRGIFSRLAAQNSINQTVGNLKVRFFEEKNPAQVWLNSV